MKRILASFALVFVSAAPALAVPTATTINKGPLLGPDRSYSSAYATDLGFTTEWFTGSGTWNIVLFGDTHKSNTDISDAYNNDFQAAFSQASWPSADTVPTLTQSGFIKVTQSSNSGDPGLSMNGAKTPGSAWPGRVGNWYGMFVRGNVYAKCVSALQCGSGMICDTSMGGIPAPDWETFRACWKPHTTPGNGCTNIQGNASIGICRDKTSSMVGFSNPSVSDGVLYSDPVDGTPRSETGKIFSAALVSEIGAIEGNVITYRTRSFPTNKFVNVAARAIASNAETDYHRPTRTNLPTTVYFWGRPNFFSNASRGAPASLYLARGVLPSGTDPFFAITYRTSTGTWSPNQTDAAPLTVLGGWPEGPASYLSVTYLEGAHKWLMLYGGEVPDLWRALFAGSIVAGLPKTDGAIRMRTAPDPWGPWSEGTVVLAPTDPQISGTFCQPFGAHCNPLFFPEQGAGVMYAPAIVESWSTSTATGATLGWFVSLWNPYQVQQMKTTITF